MSIVEKISNFYDQRSFREKLWLIPLSFVFWYLVYNILVINWIDNSNEKQLKEYAALEEKLELTNKQIGLLNQLFLSPLYKEWSVQERILKDIQQKYYQYVNAYSLENSQQIISVLLNNRSGINILQIKSELPRAYILGDKVDLKKPLFENPYIVNYSASYEEFYVYMKKLEKIMRNVQWNRLSYVVDQYPAAKIEVEFSILYEKI